jgi:hypothetical protein
VTCRALLALCLAALAVGGEACAHESASFRGVDAASGAEIALRSNFEIERNFSGSYQSPHLGTLELRQTERAHRLTGTFLHDVDGRRVTGELAGYVRGNLATFDWWETDESPARVRGKGFFLYDPGRLTTPPVRIDR